MWREGEKGMPRCLSWAVIAKCQRLGDLKNRHLCSHSSGGWKSKVKVPPGLVSGETSLPGFQTGIFSLCPHMIPSLCTW